MALTRKFLASIGLDETKIDSVIEAHIETVDALKAQIDVLKADADKLTAVQSELDTLKSAPDYKAQYEAEKEAFAKYKKENESKAQLEQVKEAYKQLLADEKISSKRFDAVLRLTDFSGMKIGEDGKLEDEAGLRKNIQTEWSEYITTERREGADVGTPPKKDQDGFSSLPLAEKMAYANKNPDAPEVINWLKS